jgi:Tfp pilus assembly protein PilO
MAKKDKKPPLISAGSGPVIAGVLVVALVAALWFLWAGPARTDASAEKAKLTESTQTLQVNEARLADIKSGKQSSADKLLVKARELDAALPPQVERVGVVAKADGLARSAGLTLAEMTPTDVIEGDGYKANNYQISVSGSPAAISTFVGQLYQWNPLTTVTKFNMTTGAEGVTATFQAAIHTVDRPVTGG